MILWESSLTGSDKASRTGGFLTAGLGQAATMVVAGAGGGRECGVSFRVFFLLGFYLIERGV